MTDEPSDRRASGAAAAVAGELRRWPDRLEGLVARRCRWLGRVVVLAETGSTQDAARRMGLLAGEAVTGRPRAGAGSGGAGTTERGPRSP